MPTPGMCWRHVVLSTHRSWLPGDPRGFRSRDHRIHSSGDYKNPPPEGEHEGLYRYWKRRTGEPIIIPPELREPAGRAILAALDRRGLRVLVLALSGMHGHLLAELPESLADVRQVVGRCKTAACYAMRETLPGTVWSRQATYKRIEDHEHQRSTYYYILRQKGAWIWSFRDEIPPPVGGGRDEQQR